MKNFKGYVQVYTGDGKGKTTAALGLCLRAAGAKMNVYIAQFMKSGEYSEIKALQNISDFITIEQFGTGEFIHNKPSEKEIETAQRGIKAIRKKSSSGDYSIVVMDEASIAITYGLINVSDVVDIIKQKSDLTELIITGRGANTHIIKLADLVTEMIDIKHYYQKGVKARIGIEK